MTDSLTKYQVSKYEYVRIIEYRVGELLNNFPPLITLTKKCVDPITIARREYDAGVLNYFLKRGDKLYNVDCKE